VAVVAPAAVAAVGIAVAASTARARATPPGATGPAIIASPTVVRGGTPRTATAVCTVTAVTRVATRAVRTLLVVSGSTRTTVPALPLRAPRAVLASGGTVLARSVVHRRPLVLVSE
jgi:hypothetical protein